MESTLPQISLTGLRRKARAVALLTLIATAPLTLSCYGRFPMTRLIYRVNGEIGGSVGNDHSQHGFVRSIVMWVFLIIPVYELASIIDIFVLNLIEFWGGGPVELGEHIAPDGTRVATVPSADGKTAMVTVTSKNGKVLGRQQLVKVSDQLLEVRNENGTLAGTAEKNANGDMTFKDASGRTVSIVPASHVPASHTL